ncbi:MAG: DCC1-like thiol-disulfide oxidoreductase family protein [Pseudomonadota bacterium]
MDGASVLRTAGARLIARFDRKGAFRVCGVQTRTGRAVLRQFGLDPYNAARRFISVDGRAYSSAEAIIRAGARIGGVGWLLQVLRVLPRASQVRLYGRLARSRHARPGRTDMCAVPGRALHARLIE